MAEKTKTKMEALNEFILQEGAEKYAESMKLSDCESKNDPETEPFKSKYKARELLHELKAEISRLGKRDDNTALAYWTAALDCRLGGNYIDTEELSTGQEHLEKCISALEDHKTEEKACSVLLVANNQLGILWSTRRHPDKALKYLTQADELYKLYKHDVGSSPYSLDELFQPEADTSEDLGKVMQKRTANFESVYTHTLYYLAQVYTQLDDNEKSAEYCHVTLRRQLESNTYEPIDWSLNAATLSQFYIARNDYNLARHCLASAQKILLEKGETSLKVEISQSDSQADVDMKEKLPRSWADLYRCWAKYGLAMLEESMNRLLEKEACDEQVNTVPNSENSENKDSAGNGASEQKKGEKRTLYFDLELTSFEEKICDVYVSSFEQARPVFLAVQKWLNMAKDFYALDGHCSDHIEITQDHSKAFKLLAFFEPDFDRQCKMHKRRIDMLQAALEQLSMQFYLLVCRQLMYELAETYSAMMDLKLAIMEESGETPSLHQAKKLNTLVSQSIAKYEEYINSLRKSDKSLPQQYASDDERPAIVAHFCLGRLHSKFLEPDISKRIQNMGKSLDYYKYIVDYSKRNPEVKSHSPSEVEICEEMAVLLPVKIEKLRSQAE